MKNKDQSYQTFLTSLTLVSFLIIFSSTALVATAQSPAYTYFNIHNSSDNTISIIDMVTNTVKVKLNVGVCSSGVAINPSETKV